MADGERTAWSDERLDEKMAAIDTTHDRIDARLARIEDGLDALRTELHEEVRALRTEMHEEIRALRADFARMQDRLVQIGFGLVVALVGNVAALIVALSS